MVPDLRSSPPNHAKYFLKILPMVPSISWSSFMTTNLRFKIYIWKSSLPPYITHVLHCLNVFQMCDVSKFRFKRFSSPCLFLRERLFSTQPQSWLTFAWIELQMLRKPFLLYVSIIIILRHFLYLAYLCPCLSLGLFISVYVIYFFVCFHFPYNQSYDLTKTRFFANFL